MACAGARTPSAIGLTSLCRQPTERAGELPRLAMHASAGCMIRLRLSSDGPLKPCSIKTACDADACILRE
eukprot:693885-Pleurochrysis_carterae.AAC.2